MIKEKRESEITVVACYPGKSATIIKIPNTLETKQAYVGGDIEAAYFWDEPVVAICNENGKMDKLEPCRAILDSGGHILDVIVGPFLICGLDDEGFISLTQEQQEQYLAMFRHPQMFFLLNGEMVVIPVEED